MPCPPTFFSLGFVIYWFHTKLPPHILEQNCAYEYTYISVSSISPAGTFVTTVGDWTAIADYNTLNGFTSNVKHSWSLQMVHLTWNPSSTRKSEFLWCSEFLWKNLEFLHQFACILPFRGRQLPNREKYSFSFWHWENDGMPLIIYLFEKLYFGQQI